ncbi:EamA-like transporter family protein [Crenobacter luteus]|uniref:Transporter n=1 Tax=Crenobacter luteus TaxID=1452487 RepID=A0A161S9C8_9NEIS|nr:DMT family transporter [Crenobacter luteus]KZE31663.1 transporter [Crenobacter luteus]TCP15523.1 EamA-like transporter family protein [Crenobacter luteus]
MSASSTAGVASVPAASRRAALGLAYGVAGVACFSGTMPATRLAVAGLDPLFIGLGRALVAAALAALLLAATRQRWPSARQWARLALVSAGVVVGFPLFSSLALASVSANHAALFTGLLPLCTALFGAWFAHERPRAPFWVCALAGSALVTGHAWLAAGGALAGADGYLIVAVVLCGLGYAEGGRLARELGSWQVICWALLLAAPFVAWPVWTARPTGPVDAASWAGFAYVSVVSMFLGFFVWYRGLALGGIARVSQVQLLQPFGGMLAAAALLGESLSWGLVGVTAAVAVCVAVGRRAA